MANPPTAKSFAQALDPSDLLDFYVVLNQGTETATPVPMLLTGEGVASYTLAPSVEAVAAGLTIRKDDPYVSTLVGNVLTVWIEVAADMRASSLFDGAGTTLGIELTITTTAVPARRKQRTFLIRIANQ